MEIKKWLIINLARLKSGSNKKKFTKFNWAGTKNAVIFFNGSDSAETELVNIFVGKLKETGADAKVLCYNAKASENIPQNGFSVVSITDFSLAGKLASTEHKEIAEADHDLFVNFCKEDLVVADLISAQIKASFKITLAENGRTDLYHFKFNPVSTDAVNTINELIKTLEKIQVHAER